ncbi:Hypothetical protein ORPV_713 [Orpheovirus IHUMI-LCC2]|uniref:Uncharacterized protein n=1 Tax=Orpheovirus IHUMI-LCC2 TaxID=2023057 RepID=A0A2I2L517_9VIRU|nr:Hypothetical protein ORPV_713 [Orpheovirus IHUMI-LCC2]SNW62617.1 Hypothetical protein ORPV_713 [Orpheovirus IHUMI-LCC2]
MEYNPKYADDWNYLLELVDDDQQKKFLIKNLISDIRRSISLKDYHPLIYTYVNNNYFGKEFDLLLTNNSLPNNSKVWDDLRDLVNDREDLDLLPYLDDKGIRYSYYKNQQGSYDNIGQISYINMRLNPLIEDDDIIGYTSFDNDNDDDDDYSDNDYKDNTFHLISTSISGMTYDRPTETDLKVYKDINRSYPNPRLIGTDADISPAPERYNINYSLINTYINFIPYELQRLNVGQSALLSFNGIDKRLEIYRESEKDYRFTITSPTKGTDIYIRNEFPINIKINNDTNELSNIEL